MGEGALDGGTPDEGATGDGLRFELPLDDPRQDSLWRDAEPARSLPNRHPRISSRRYRLANSARRHSYIPLVAARLLIGYRVTCNLVARFATRKRTFARKWQK